MTKTRVRASGAMATVTTIVAMVAVLLSGCGAVRSMTNHGVSNPMTPEQSRAQVVDAARELVAALRLPVTRAVFSHDSCNDQGEAPFQGHVVITYPLGPSFEASDAAQADMVTKLQSQGWSTDSDAHTHGMPLKKNGVKVTFWPQNAATPNNGIDLWGECRDVTTTKDTRGASQDITLT
jgi:hypothetical protein